MAKRSGNRRETPLSNPTAATPGKPHRKLSEIRCGKIASAREGSPLCGSPQSGKRGAPLRIFLAAKLYLVMSALGEPDVGWTLPGGLRFWKGWAPLRFSLLRVPSSSPRVHLQQAFASRVVQSREEAGIPPCRDK